MTKFIISIQENPSKTEELNALFKFAHKMPTGSFLSHLFTDDFLGWTQSCIRGDILPNIYGWYVTEVVRAEDHRRDARAANEILDAGRGELAELRLSVRSTEDRWATDADEKRQQIDAWKNKAEWLLGELGAEADDRIMYQDRNRELEQEIVELKAKLYDQAESGEGRGIYPDPQDFESEEAYQRAVREHELVVAAI